MDFRLVLTTCKDQAEARAIGKALVEERLAACVNIVPGIESIYRWKGKIEEGSEALLLAKTRVELVHGLMERVKKMHSYACPCIVVVPIVGGSEECCAWINKETT